jgi:hypothetical protein
MAGRVIAVVSDADVMLASITQVTSEGKHDGWIVWGRETRGHG